VKLGFRAYTPTALTDLADKVPANTAGVAVWMPLAALIAAVVTADTALRRAITGSGAGHTTVIKTAHDALANSMSAFATG
jgi:hypothetical protein